MNIQDILTALKLGEDKDWEFKSAKGGLPASMWETYSAMANTDGGVIGLGIDEKDGKFWISGLSDAAKMKKNFWDTINNKGKVSINLLTDTQANVVEAEGKSVLIVEVPRANRRERPVYVGQNPLDGTYRRNYEGDYKCRRDEVGRMLADQSEEALDSQILEHFGIGDLDKASIEQYRNRFSARTAAHPWLKLNEEDFLEKIGALRTDRQTGMKGVTVAGLLMFGKDEAIRDPDSVPEFNLDYRERLSDDPAVRWTDRIHADGTWVCNIFQFYERVVPRLTADLKIPFQFAQQLGGATTTTTPPPEVMQRQDDTIVHVALREAMVNALIHADFRGQGGIVIEKYRDRFELSNPGSLLVSIEQILKGGVSECRNKTVQKMFSFLGYGERAGSGFDKIRQGWESQQWRSPKVEETARPDRVKIVLPMVSLLPENSIARLQSRFGTKFKRLNPLEVQALVTADIEGGVSNARMQQIANEHPMDLTKMLQGLATKRLLHQVGQKRGATYQLPGLGGLSHSAEDSSHKDDSSQKPAEDSSHKLESLTEEQRKRLDVLAAPAFTGSRLPVEETRTIILQLCDGNFFTAVELGELMNRNPNSLRNRFLTPLVEEELLLRKYPDEPNRPDQAYTTKK